MNKLMYDIIIPSWNQSKLAIKCLESIKKYSKKYRVIFVDNCSDKDEFDKIYDVLKTMPHKLIKNTKNLGFVKATNQGIYFSSAPFIVFMNNDTEAAPNWLEKLNAPLKNNVGLSGPRTTTKNSWQGRWPEKPGIFILKDGSMLAFFCTMLRRDVIEKVGYLDECFGVGFGDDDDYCLRANNCGFKLALVQDLVIPHHHRSTFKKLYTPKNIHDMQSRAIKMFHDKKNKMLNKKEQ